MSIDRIASLLGSDADDLLGYTCTKVPKSNLHLPGPDFIDRVVTQSDRKPSVLVNLQRMLDHGRLGGTGYVSILPVDQGIEHSGGASFAPNPTMFDPSSIVELAIEGGCSGVASTYGVLRSVARKYAHKIPFVVKVNHNEILSYPNTFDQVPFGSVQQAFDMGAAGIGATITPAAPASITLCDSRAILSSPAPDTPTTTGTLPATRSSTCRANWADSSPDSFGASPMMPRMVMPVTPQSR